MLKGVSTGSARPSAGRASQPASCGFAVPFRGLHQRAPQGAKASSSGRASGSSASSSDAAKPAPAPAPPAAAPASPDPSPPPGTPSGSAGAGDEEGVTEAVRLPPRDRWEETLNPNLVLYRPKTNYVEYKQIDHARKRRERDLREVVEAGRKLGIDEGSIRSGVGELQALLPDLGINLDKMKASDWAKVLSDSARAAHVVITLRTAYPRANISAVLLKAPKMLLRDAAALAEDAAQVKAMLTSCEDVDAIIEEVPYLADPAAVAQSLANLARWFPQQDPRQLLQHNPSLLVNIEEADLEADPLYGEVTTT